MMVLLELFGADSSSIIVWCRY